MKGDSSKRNLAAKALGRLAMTTGLLGVAVSPCIILGLSEAVGRSTREGYSNVLWEEFEGSVPGYRAEISEVTNKNGSKYRTVSLNALDNSTIPARITGHDDEIDGHFERVFIMNGEFDACDSVLFTPKGLVWEPSPYSSQIGKTQFTEMQVVNAQNKLYGALANVRKEDNQTRHWVSGMGAEDHYGLIEKIK